MARIKIELPASFNFQTTIAVRITDLNYGGHVGNDAILSIIHEARMQFLKHHGYTEMDLGGTGVIMNDVAIEFKTEAFYGDQISAMVAAGDISKVSFDLFYKLQKTEGDKTFVVALAKTGMICYDYSKKKMTPVPEDVRTKLAG